MTDRELPLQWVPLFEKKNLGLSVRALGRAIDMHQSTAGRVVHGEKTSRVSLSRVANYFGVPVADVQHLRREQPTKPFEVPAEADALTPKQREAVRAIILAMVEPGEKIQEQQLVR